MIDTYPDYRRIYHDDNSTRAIAQDEFSGMDRQSVAQRKLSQGLNSENPGLIVPTDSSNWQDIFPSLQQKEEEEPPSLCSQGQGKNERSSDLAPFWIILNLPMLIFGPLMYSLVIGYNCANYLN